MMHIVRLFAIVLGRTVKHAKRQTDKQAITETAINYRQTKTTIKTTILTI